MVWMGFGGLFGLIGLVCSIIILIHAFKRSVGTGFMVLCIPCYILYYAFAQFEHPNKNLIVGGLVASLVLSGVFYGAGQATLVRSYQGP